MKINQVSLASNNPGKFSAMIAFILSTYKIFQELEFSQEPFSYNTYPVKPDVANPDGGDNETARAINAALKKFIYSPSSGGGTQRAYGFEWEIDEAYQNDVKIGAVTPAGLIRQIENEQLRLAKKVAKDVLYDMFNGSGVAPYILGLNNFVKDVADADDQSEVFGLTKAQVHSARYNMNLALDVDDETTLWLFEQALRQVIAEFEGDPILVANSTMYAFLGTIAKKLHVFGTTTNDFGKQTDMFGNVRMVPVPNYFLPFAGEPVSTSPIYLIDYNEADGVRYATNTGFHFTDFETLEEKPTGKSRLQFIGNLKIEDPKKIKRICGVSIAA